MIRTFRRVWEVKDGKVSGKPTKEVVYHLSSHSPYEKSAEVFASYVRSHWGVESYHGKRDNAFLEDKTARRVNPKLQTAMLIGRSVGLWYASCHKDKTTAEAQTDLFLHTRKTVWLFTKRGML